MKLTFTFLFIQTVTNVLGEHYTFGLHKGEYAEPITRMRMLETFTPIYGNTSSINYYYTNLYLGTPPKKQSLIIDTGSLVTAVPCKSICEQCGTHLNSYYDFTGKLLVI
jgi:hypothetical protein